MRTGDTRLVRRAEAVHPGNHRVLELAAVAFFLVPHFHGHAEMTLVAVRPLRHAGLPTLAEQDLDLALPAVPNQLQRQALTRLELADQALRLARTLDRAPGDAKDDIVLLQATLGRTLRGRLRHHQRAAIGGNAEHGGFVGRQLADDPGDTGIAPARRSLAQLGDRLHDGVDRDRVANTDIGPVTGRVDGGIDADDTAMAIEQGSTRATRVDRRIGLQVGKIGVPKSPGMRNDATRDRVGITAERIAHREGFVTGPYRVGIAKFRLRDTRAMLETQDGNIGPGRGIDQLRLDAGAIRPAARVNLDQGRIGDHVMIGPHLAGCGGHQEPGAIGDVPHRIAVLVDGNVGNGANGD